MCGRKGLFIMSKDYKEKKVTWSKGSVLCTATIFISVVALVFWLYISGNIQNMYDVTLLATLVSVSGAIFGSNLVWYSKKAGSENQYKLRMHMYEEAARVRLEFNEGMLKLQQKYDVSKEDLEMIDLDGDTDEFMDSALSNASAELDEAQSEFDSPDNMETF